MSNPKPNVYPIYVTIAETTILLGLGRSSIYKLINSGDLVTAKFGRAVRILFSSIIAFALSSLKNGNGKGEVSKIFHGITKHDRIEIADYTAQRLYNTHYGLQPAAISDDNTLSHNDPATHSAACDQNQNMGEI